MRQALDQAFQATAERNKIRAKFIVITMEKRVITLGIATNPGNIPKIVSNLCNLLIFDQSH